MNTNRRGVVRLVFIFLSLHFSLLVSNPCIATGPFPVFPCLEPNVRFWIDTYTKYPTTTGIIHDALDLEIVYGFIDLLPQEKAGALRANQERIRAAKDRYRNILQELAENKDPEDAEKKRIADLFGPKAGPEAFREAIDNVRCQVGQQDRFERGLIRSGVYLRRIRAIFRSHGLPEDLCYLPHVESSFDVTAYSKAGAAGIWQFTRATGKKYLKVSKQLDERRDPIRASEAAAKLLKHNYERLGDWPMAVTAYNHGIAGMLRAKKEMDTYEAVFENYNGPLFRFASRNFYSEFLAARHVAKNHTQYFGDIRLTRSLEALEVVTKGQMSAAELSLHYNVDLETLRLFNPGLGQRVFKGQRQVPKGYLLRLPADSAKAIKISSATLSQIHPDLRQ
ncbi:MAG: lytic transglycosylase domain-containing protein [Deltaproteobacteria bacterium]